MNSDHLKELDSLLNSIHSCYRQQAVAQMLARMVHQGILGIRAKYSSPDYMQDKEVGETAIWDIYDAEPRRDVTSRWFIVGSRSISTGWNLGEIMCIMSYNEEVVASMPDIVLKIMKLVLD